MIIRDILFPHVPFSILHEPEKGFAALSTREDALLIFFAK
jgi:hypothetical protein